MKKLIIPLFITLSVSACTNITPSVGAEKARDQPILTSYNSAERYSSLLWVERANPVSDASKALEKGDTQLWAYNTRKGPKIPGIDGAISDVLQNYQLRMAPAMGDVVYGNEHLELQLKFIKYAQRYNQEILNSQ
ncbi:MAG: hypothetical protein KBT75_17500 [Oleispira antarctica]|uniref:Lipoprotein n=1 Tax=Oleispira antarctica RB-8 TaxID=698738 RepID=R4YVD5_OLEAN|nr:hypothetical protein [Oleispira antarctica]CCK78009.1 hypothetical protein OLEAN_C38330 [Oleispira antarctica RB-8]|tara:strand:- start:1579 stop:1983 length:405 start_codon:yes stop_codon:yes gene_type:complete